MSGVNRLPMNADGKAKQREKSQAAGKTLSKAELDEYRNLWVVSHRRSQRLTCQAIASKHAGRGRTSAD